MKTKVSTQAKILNLINSKEIELPPWKIADELGLNRSTVRNQLRRLLEQGKILQPYPGTYASHITYGMMVTPLRIHNLVLQVTTPWLNFSDEIEEHTGKVKIRIQFGLQRRRVTGFISCDSGMDFNSVHFAINRFYDLFEEKTGHTVEKIIVKTFEANRDVQGVRIDGKLGCFTKKAFDGLIARIYNKGDAVRSEYKVTQDMSIESFQTLIEGGLSSYTATQTSFQIRQDVAKLVDAVKFQCDKINQLVSIVSKKDEMIHRLVEATLQRLNREDKG